MFVEVFLGSINEKVYGFAFSGDSFLIETSSDLILYKIDGTDKRIDIDEVDEIDDLGYCCGKFGVLQSIEDEEKVNFYLLDKEGNIINTFNPMSSHDTVFSIDKDGILICGGGCGFYSFSGKLLWLMNTNQDVDLKPVKVGEYWLVGKRVGEIIEAIKPGEDIEILGLEDDKAIYSFDACNNKLVVSTMTNELLFYDISNILKPKFEGQIKLEKPYSEKFSPDCRIFAVISAPNIFKSKRILYMFHDKQVIFKKEYGLIAGLSWSRNLLAVVSSHGEIFVFIYQPTKIGCFQ